MSENGKSGGNTALKTLALDALHRELGARMGAFAGYDMPIQYPAGLKAEHLHARSQAGLFDVSHMGQLRVRGPQLQRTLESVLPVDFDDWPAPAADRVGQQRYSLLLNDTGGIEDDLMLVNLGNEVRIVVNAGNRDADLARLRALAPALDFEWIDASLLALQGPAAESVLAALDPNATTLRFMQSRLLDLLGVPCFTTRSGYTGEDGYEISVPTAHAMTLARALLTDERVRPIGLGARDTLRLEAGLPLHGHDIDASTSPVEAGLAFALPKSRRTGMAKAGGFPGAAIILEQLANGPSRRLVGLVSESNIPIRSAVKIVDATERERGIVTSGTVSPSLGKPIALAYLESQAVLESKAAANRQGLLFAAVRDKRPGVSLQPLPFTPKRYKR